jgi:toxin ParE1/3/4
MATAASEAVASRFVTAIEAAFEPLRYFTLAAPARDQFAPGLRVTFHQRYAIYYRPLPDARVIVRVLHGARDAVAIADHGRFAG